jgi:hypothetical protein
MTKIESNKPGAKSKISVQSSCSSIAGHLILAIVIRPRAQAGKFELFLPLCLNLYVHDDGQTLEPQGKILKEIERIAIAGMAV